MSQKILLLGLVVIVALGASVFAMMNNSNQVPTVNLTATENGSTSGSSNSVNSVSSSSKQTSTSSNNAKASTGSNSSGSSSSGSTSGSSSSSSSSGSDNGGWTTVVPSSTNTHSETTG